MRTLRTLAFLLLGLTASPTVLAQNGPEITVFKTYEDFEAKRGQDYERYSGYMHVMGKVTLFLYDRGEKEKVKCANIWGFRYKDALFRVDKRYEQPAKLMSYGRLCYYENGMAISRCCGTAPTGPISRSGPTATCPRT